MVGDLSIAAFLLTRQFEIKVLLQITAMYTLKRRLISSILLPLGDKPYFQYGKQMNPWAIGWKVAIGASIFISANGLFSLCSFLYSLATEQSNWISGAGVINRSLAEIAAFDQNLATYFIIVNVVAWANLTVSGAVVFCATWFGVRKKQKWGWWTLLAILIWAGVMDSLAIIFVYSNFGTFIPTAPVMMVFGVAVLAMTRAECVE